MPDQPSGRRARRRGNGEGTIAIAPTAATPPPSTSPAPTALAAANGSTAGPEPTSPRNLATLAHGVANGVVVPTRSPTLSDYLDYWMTHVVEPKLRPCGCPKLRVGLLSWRSVTGEAAA